jgi:hypothetical protein
VIYLGCHNGCKWWKSSFCGDWIERW